MAIDIPGYDLQPDPCSIVSSAKLIGAIGLFKKGVGVNDLPFPEGEAPPQHPPFPFDLNEPALDTEEVAGQHTAEEGNLTPAHSHQQPSKSKLSDEKRIQILLRLLQIHTATGELYRRQMTGVASEFGVSTRTASRIWTKAKAQIDANQRPNVSNNYQNCGRKRVQVNQEAISAISMGDRTCLRDLASKMGISKSAAHRLIKRGDIKPHTNALKPGLKEANKITRLQWILSLLQGGTLETKKQYYAMYDFVHIDEKWFQLSKKSQRCYLAKNERGQYRAASSSKFIPKVMFTAAVARPRYDAQGQCTFDGKIGIFPFTYQEPAKRKSKNRAKGTMVTKLVESVNQKVTRQMLINEIVPAIKAKWPVQGGAHQVIFIQQDNAKAHISQEDAEWQQVYQQDGFTFILTQQPPNSPDLNILDLGFFRSIQSLMHKKMPKNVDAMMEAVNEAFYELDPKTLVNVWMSMQYVMNEILKCKGSNDYDLPHVNKNRLQLLGTLPIQVEAPMWAVKEAWQILYGQPSQNPSQPAMQATEATQETEDNQHEAYTQDTEAFEDMYDFM